VRRCLGASIVGTGAASPTSYFCSQAASPLASQPSSLPWPRPPARNPCRPPF
jgi:hypothetical protein